MGDVLQILLLRSLPASHFTVANLVSFHFFYLFQQSGLSDAQYWC